MKVALTLKDFLETYFSKYKAYIRVERCDDQCIGFKPTHHAWSKINDAEVVKDYDAAEKDGRMNEYQRTLAYTGQNFNPEEEYPDICNWYVHSIYDDCFTNPICGMSDWHYCIAISETLPEGFTTIGGNE